MTNTTQYRFPGSTELFAVGLSGEVGAQHMLRLANGRHPGDLRARVQADGSVQYRSARRLQVRTDDGTDPEMHATAQAASLVLRELQPPVMRGFSEVAQLVGEVSVVAAAVRWTAAAIGEQIQRIRDQRRQERDGAAERTDLIELY